MPKRRPTIADVARAAGVAKSTASKALAARRGRYPVSAPTRAKVLGAARRLGFAAADRTGTRHGRIALLFANEAPNLDGINLRLHVALVDQLRQRQLEVVYQSMDRGSREARRRALSRVDGCLLVSRTPVRAADWQAWLAELDGLPPAVAINAGTALPIPRVEPDDAGGAARLFADLVQQGHRRLAVVGRLHQPDPQHGSHHLRHATLLAQARGAPVALADWTDLDDETVARRLPAAGGAAPTALIGLSGWRFPALWSALMRSGIAMPERVALATCDDPPFNPQMAPPVSGVTWSMGSLVELALAALDTVLAGGTPAPVTLVAQQVIHRASTLAWRPPG